jgi:hypothetical protein
MSTAIYATTAEIRDRIDKTGTADDAILDALLSAASRAIDGYCNRPDGFVALTTATARFYPGSGKSYQWIDECVEVTAVAVKDSASDEENQYDAWTVGTVGTTTGADVFLASGDPEYPEFTRLPYTLLIIGANGDFSVFPSGEFRTRGGFRPASDSVRGVPSVKVTAKWGYSATIPANVREATILQAARWYKRGQSAWADTVANTDLGVLMYRKVIDPDLQAMLMEARLVRPALSWR